MVLGEMTDRHDGVCTAEILALVLAKKSVPAFRGDFLSVNVVDDLASKEGLGEPANPAEGIELAKTNNLGALSSYNPTNLPQDLEAQWNIGTEE